MKGGWRQVAHDGGLLFCGAIGAYLLSMLVVRLVGVPLVQAIRDWQSLAARVVLGVLAQDLSRAPVLLAVALAIRGSIHSPPLAAAAALVLLTYGFDLAVAAILGQLGPLYGSLAVVLCRLAAAALLTWLTFLVFRRRRR